MTRKYSPRHFNENQCTRSFLFPRMPEVFNRIKLSAIVTREYTHTHTQRLANKLTNTQNNTDIHLHIPENCVKMYRRRHAGTQAWLIQHARGRKTPVTLSCSALRCTTWCERSFTIAHRGSAALCHNPAGCCRTPSTTFC